MHEYLGRAPANRYINLVSQCLQSNKIEYLTANHTMEYHRFEDADGSVVDGKSNADIEMGDVGSAPEPVANPPRVVRARLTRSPPWPATVFALAVALSLSVAFGITRDPVFSIRFALMFGVIITCTSSAVTCYLVC